MPVRIQLRRDTAANWTSTNPTLTQGEVGIETNTGKFKIGDGTTAWNSLGYRGGGAVGGGTDDTFYENSAVVSSSYTITSGKNAISAGPITVNSGVTVTVPSGSTWVIV